MNKNLILILMILSFFFINKVQAKSQVVDKIAYLVNDDIILQSEIDNRVKFVKDNNPQIKNIPKKSLEKQIAEGMVVELILLQTAKKRGITVDSGILTEQMKRIAKSQNMNLTSFIKYLNSKSKDGYRKYYEQLKKQLIINKLQQAEISKQIRITDQEVNNIINSKTNFSYFVSYVFIELGDNNQDIIDNETNEIADILNKYGFDYANSLYGDKYRFRYYKNVKKDELPNLVAVNLPEKQREIKLIRNEGGSHFIILEQKQNNLITDVELYKVRQILQNPASYETDKQVKKRLDDLFNSLNKNNFAQIAQSSSQDYSSNYKGGDMGWLQLSELNKVFKANLTKLKIGQISNPFRDNTGWHIIMLEDIVKKPLPADKIKNQVYISIYKLRFNHLLNQWINEIKSQAFVKSFE